MNSPNQQNAVKVHDRVKYLCDRHGGLRPAARLLGIDPGYLSRLRAGTKKQPSQVVLRKLGLQRHVFYTMRD